MWSTDLTLLVESACLLILHDMLHCLPWLEHETWQAVALHTQPSQSYRKRGVTDGMYRAALHANLSTWHVCHQNMLSSYTTWQQ